MRAQMEEDRGMAIELGVFVVPLAADAALTVEQVVLADELGLDVVGVQDHPYQRRFLDTWTLLAYVAARTTRLRLVTDVSNLPLRPPAMLAKAAASLDILSGGRLELGLGAGAFWDAIVAMGGPRLTPKESVDALEEAVAVLRAYWRGDDPVRVEGEHYTVKGARPGPVLAHPIGIWLGAYGPRMLRVTGRLADGWLPSLGFGKFTEDELAARHAVVDAAAQAAGREPSDVRRALNLTLGADRSSWADTLARLAQKRFETFIVSADGDPLEVIAAVAELAVEVRAMATGD
jgi:alkanesulfonate monooxygenase SsuD/methylene tetrahydromethanopterin reductase-like flavin-dependent oxidoreductase (luciferase family)